MIRIPQMKEKNAAKVMTRHWKLDFVSNKAKERILKRVLQEYKTYQIFEKKNVCHP